MGKREIAQQYIEFLSDGDITKVVNLFEENGIVNSPIYGRNKADKFYKILGEDTDNSELEIKGIFEDSETERLALYFRYKWTVKTGKIVEFDVVDIIEFDSQNKILELTIIYDTVISRKLIEEIKNKPASNKTL